MPYSSDQVLHMAERKENRDALLSLPREIGISKVRSLSRRAMVNPIQKLFIFTSVRYGMARQLQCPLCPLGVRLTLWHSYSGHEWFQCASYHLVWGLRLWRFVALPNIVCLFAQYVCLTNYILVFFLLLSAEYCYAPLPLLRSVPGIMILLHIVPTLLYAVTFLPSANLFCLLLGVTL